jgi:hypothetical protein
MLSDFWQWLHDTSPGQATFLGSVFGFLALLCGAWANASFNRRRDDRLRREEQRGLATVLRAELAGCRGALLGNAEQIEKINKNRRARIFLTPDLAHSIRIMPHMIPKFGLLDEETVDKVANAYLAVEQHSEELLLLGARLVDPERVSAEEAQLAEEAQSAGEAQSAEEAQSETRASGRRRLMSFSPDKAPQVIALNSRHAEAIKEAIDRLDEFLRGLRYGSRLRRAWRWMRATG